MSLLAQAELTRALPDVLDYWRKWLDLADEGTLVAWRDAAFALAIDCNRRLHELRTDAA